MTSAETLRKEKMNHVNIWRNRASRTGKVQRAQREIGDWCAPENRKKAKSSMIGMNER